MFFQTNTTCTISIKNYLPLLACLFLLHPSKAQQRWESVLFSYSRTTIIKHSSRYRNIEDLGPGSMTVLGLRHTPAAGAGRVSAGVNMTYYNSGSKVLGNGWGAFGNLHLPFFVRGRFQSLFSMGLGGILMERPYHPVRNASNRIIGSTFNAFATVGCQLEYRLCRQWSVLANGGLAHISNGAYRLPNIGINVLQTGLGLRFIPIAARRNESADITETGEQAKNPRFFNSVRVGAGRFQKRDFEGQYFTNLNAAVFQHVTVFRNFALSAGLYLEYTDYIERLRSRYPAEVDRSNYRAAIEMNLNWFFQQLYLTGGVGYYLHKPDISRSKNHLYYRLAANYCFLKKGKGYRGTPYLGVGLKAYKNIAQHPEITGGYLF